MFYLYGNISVMYTRPETIKASSWCELYMHIHAMPCFTFFLTLFFCITLGRVKSDCAFPDKIGNQADYYWRDYFGVVPRDAVPGGYSEDGNVTYIGQLAGAKYPGIFPGNLYSGRKEAVAAIDERVEDGTYVKILCSNPSNKFEWIATNADDSHLLTDYHWPIGGSQGTTVSYIGRANFEGRVQVGRVFNSKIGDKGLWLYNNAGVQINFKSFELLVLAR